ncbi:MAG: GIY-YIG nuclease family protein [Rickettsiales bacterium]|jgi:hypothetical protein|nr:GIY-YIG nuclease family protein [Rickettsiales bacterium]
MILLADIFNFDKLLQTHPGKRIKLRFNTSWNDEIEPGNVVHCSYKEMYINQTPGWNQEILSMGSESKKRLQNNDIVFQFIKIAEPDKWLFVGASDIIDTDNCMDGFNKLTGRSFKYARVKNLPEYDKFAGRVIVDWKNKPQQFFYTSTEIVNSVQVREILSEHYLTTGDEFPGYENVCKSYLELKHSIKNNEWKTALSSVYGVYVITDTKNGKQYVGSAYGEDGIFGRWSVYLKNGYETSSDYPNKRLKELVKTKGIDYVKDNFQYAIIETFPKTENGKEKALQRESYWKEVLHTREFGYNDN